MAQLSKIARWDKLKSWKGLEDEIEDRLSSSDKFDDAMTLEIGPQLLHTLRHRSALRCIEHTSSKFGEIFTCHFNKGAVQGVRVWVLELEGKDGSCKIKAFEMECEITCMTYVTKHRVYLVFCSDLTLRVITDARSNFVEVERVPCLTTTLCLVYNKEDDEIYAGGIGTIEEWKIHGAEHAASLVPGRKFFTDLTRNDWIRDIKIVRHHNYMVAQHGNGLCVVHLKSRKQLHMLPNRHEGPLICCCYYPQSDFLMTGGAEGKIRIFNGKEFDLLHVFTGHHGAVSAMEAHRKEALLFSASHDGTVRIWRMDNLQIFMRLDVGEKIYNMALLSDTKFYFQTEKNILIYSCNQFCQFFAPLESDTKRLLCCRGKDHPNRILASTEDGSVWLFSPKTGLTLTIIYPMPSFQVLMSFAYDIHQDRLHTVLTGGKVITYNTSTNPCKAEEIWVPSCEDEQVNLLLLVTVEFPYDEGTDLDNLIFAGLTNGQIILCDAVACALECPVQAHEGAVTSLESSLHQSGVGHFGSGDNVSIVISGGTDKYVKVWKINIDTDGRRPIVKLTLLFKVYLASSPLHVCMYSHSLWVTNKIQTERGTKWKLLLHKVVLIASSKTEASKRKHLLHNKYVLKVRQITHPDDEDHVKELTSLDKCPIMNVVMTSGKDGFVKIWSGENQLLREMNFATPIYASCFANDRGDILVGYGTHICSVSVVNYLPLDFLKQVISISKFCIKDDIREVPVKFDNRSEPWLDIANLREYSINSFDRRRQHLEEEVIERLKRATGKDDSKPKAKFVIFVDGKTTKVIRKDFADKLLGWAKGKTKLKFGVKKPEVQSLLADNSPETENKVAAKFSRKRKNVSAAATRVAQTDSSVKENRRVFFDSESLLEIYPSAVGKALKHLGNQKNLGPEEMRLLNEQELLKKDPIIAPDGYIPNSVIRRKLKPLKDVSFGKVEKPFKLKPVPKANPQHMPVWWEEEKECESPRIEYRVMKWDDTPSPPPKSEISSVSSVSLKSLIESPVKKYIAEGRSKTTTPRSPKSKSEQKNGTRSVSKSRNDMTPVENVKKMVKANNENMKPRKSGWEDSPPSEMVDTEQMRSKPMSRLSDMLRFSSNLSDASKTGDKVKPGTPNTFNSSSAKSRASSSTGSSIVMGRRLDLSRLDFEMKTPDSARRGRQSGAQSEGKEKSFKLTDYAVDEDSSAIHVKETKSGRRLKSHLNHTIIKQLLKEEWMPGVEEDFDYNDIINHLVTILGNSDNSVVYESACSYIGNLFKQMGMTEDHLEQFLGMLGINLDHIDSSVRKNTVRTLQALGEGRLDVLVMILPKLLDQEESVRQETADAIRVLTGATDKETLLNILEELGVTSTYSSKADEMYTLAMLAEKFGEHLDDPQVVERIKHWLEATTPGTFEIDKEDEDMLWQEGTRSGMCQEGTRSGMQWQEGTRSGMQWQEGTRSGMQWQEGTRSGKEYSFMSEGKSAAGGPTAGVSSAAKRDGPLTPRSRGTGSTFKRRMKDYDGFSTISDRSSSSRKSRRSERTPTSDIGRRNSSRADDLKLRQDSQSELQSTASTEYGLPLPYTLPSQARNSRFSGTSSSRSHQRIGMKVSPRNVLQETQENVSEAKTEDVIAMNESSRMTEAEVVPMMDKAKTASTERTTVSIDTNTASIDTQLVSKGTPTNTPEIPTQANELPLSTQDAAVTGDNQRMEPISEDIETASFLKTPRDPASVIPMVAKETGERDIEKLSRFLPKSSYCYDYYDNKKDSKSEESKSGKQFHKDSEQELEKLAAEKKQKEQEQLAAEKIQKEQEQLATEKIQEEQEQATEKIQDKDSDYQTISNIPSSQIADRLSGFDSGISKDMSEFSYGRAFGRGFPHAPLSPVKSESGSPPLPLSALKSPKGKGKDWRKFFEMVPNAQERKQMEQIRREMEQGKLKHATLPPISYFAEDLPMLPGEAGTRLLQTVRVGEKMQVPGDGRHRIKTVPGKLAVHTQNEDAGLSNFGIIQMQWTTGVPTVKDRIYPPQQIPQHRSHRMIQGHDESELNSTRIRQGMSEEELNLPYLDTASPALSNRYAPNQYEWEFPLPPPPAKESRTEVPQIKKDHETYCKYYQLVKKKLHLYTSPLGFIPALIAAEKERPKPKVTKYVKNLALADKLYKETLSDKVYKDLVKEKAKERTKHLPQVFVKRLPNQDKQKDTTSGETPKKQRSLTKTDITSPVMFPPIKLRQLVNIC